MTQEKCVLCDGSMEVKEVSVSRNWKGKKVTFHGFKAYVCQQCNEMYFFPEEIKLMESLTEAAIEEDKESPVSMDVKDVASYLRVSTQTVYNMLKRGDLPATKVGREWRFNKRDVLRALRVYAESHESSLSVACRAAGELDDEGKDKAFQVVLESMEEYKDKGKGK